MTKDQLITKLVLEVEELKDQSKINADAVREVNKIMCCVGGPLNDNKMEYTVEQLGPFSKIAYALGLA